MTHDPRSQTQLPLREVPMDVRWRSTREAIQVPGSQGEKKGDTMIDRNCLSYWFPKLQAAGVPVPRTELLTMPNDAAKVIWSMFDGKCTKKQAATLATFDEDVAKACDRIGYPCFLRTGQFSGKHNWKETCFIPDRECVDQHIFNICEMSEVCGMFGELPWNVWAVREMLPTEPITILPMYGDFPLVREVRTFVSDGKVLCSHPYWPKDSIKQGFDKTPRNLIRIAKLAHDLKWSEFMPTAKHVASVFAGDGAWSVDLLPTKRGWFVTDMAIAERSFHWPGCTKAKKRKAAK